MERKEREKLYKKAVEKWGEDSQLDQLVEEMAELTVAINKYKRAKNSIAQKKDGVMENLFEEIADVKMCIEELEWMFGKENVDNIFDTKLQKFIGQLNE